MPIGRPHGFTRPAKYLEVLVNGIRDSRKFFLAFDPGDRQVRVRFIAEEQARPETEVISRLGWSHSVIVLPTRLDRSRATRR